MPYHLIIFEDNTRLRQSLEMLLNDETYFQVVVSYPDCDKADEIIENNKVDLVVMDIDMPGIGGVTSAACSSELRARKA
jgi:DNA-binding response OmpR family regulator